MNATTPIAMPIAAGVLSFEVGSEPGPPKGAALLTVMHFLSVHVSSSLQSLFVEHVFTVPSTRLVGFVMADEYEVVKPDVGVAVSDSRSWNSTSSDD